MKVLFPKENIRSIHVENLNFLNGDKKWFTLNLKEVKQINFNRRDIYNIVVPKKVLFAAGEYGLDFVKEDYLTGTREHFPIEINNKRMSMGINKCMSIYLNFDTELVANCLYESNFLPYSFLEFEADKTLLDSIKK